LGVDSFVKTLGGGARERIRQQGVCSMKKTVAIGPWFKEISLKGCLAKGGCEEEMIGACTGKRNKKPKYWGDWTELWEQEFRQYS